MSISYWDWLVLIVYFLAMAYAGVYFARRNTSTEEYFVGNRALPGWVIGLSLVGTSISSQSFLGIPADTYKTTWIRFTFGLGLPFAVLAGAYVFLPFYRRGKITSAFEYLESRFGPVTRVYGAVAFLVSQITRLAMILYLLGIMMATVTGAPPMLAVLLCGLIVAFYTVAGGIEAVVWTDVVQTVLLSVGAVLCLVVIAGALPEGLSQIFTVGLADSKFSFAELAKDGSLKTTPWHFSLNEKTGLMIFFVGLTHFMAEYACNQNVVQRYCASSSAREARKAMAICLIGSLFIWTFFRFLGTALYVFYKSFPDDNAFQMLTGGQKAEAILPHFIASEMPRGLVGLILAAIFAAAMSSLDSSINAVSTVTVVDLYRRHMVKDRDDAHYLRVARWVAIVTSAGTIVGAWAFLFSGGETLADASVKIGALMAGGLLGLYVLGFTTTRADERAVIVAIVCTVVWTCYATWLELDSALPAALRLPGYLRVPINTYYTGVAGHILMFVVGYVMGLFLSRREQSLENLTIWTQDGIPLK